MELIVRSNLEIPAKPSGEVSVHLLLHRFLGCSVPSKTSNPAQRITTALGQSHSHQIGLEIIPQGQCNELITDLGTCTREAILSGTTK